MTQTSLINVRLPDLKICATFVKVTIVDFNFQMENSYNYRTAISLHPVPRNIRCLEWGPNGFFAVAFENFVTIYQLTSSSLRFIRSISRHVSNITCIRWSIPSVEILRSDSFNLFIACGDESGNCIIYDLFSGKRSAGISPDVGNELSILDISWSPLDPSVIFVLTSFPSLICFKVGSYQRRRSSFMESNTDGAFSFKSFNMRLLWSYPLRSQFHKIIMDPFSPLHILVTSNQSHYFLISLHPDSRKSSVSTTSQFPSPPNDQTLIYCQFFPFSPHKVVLVYPHQLLLVDLIDQTSSQFGPSSDLRNIAVDNLFSASEPSAFWHATADGSLCRFVLNGDSWNLLQSFPSTGVASFAASVDPFNPSRVILLSSNGRLVIYEQKAKKVFAIASIPGFPDDISVWTANSGRIAFAIPSGIVCIVTSEERLRFSAADTKISSIAFVGQKKLAICGSSLSIFDMSNRSLKKIQRRMAPTDLVVCGASLAYNPVPNVIDIVNGDMINKRAVFSALISAFAGKENDPTQWVVFLSGIPSAFVLSVSSEKITQKRFSIPEVDVNSAVFVDESIIFSSHGVLYSLNIATKDVKPLLSVPISSIEFNSNSLLLVDKTKNVLHYDMSEGKVNSSPKWKVFSAKFFSSNLAAIQTSASSLRLVQLPDFETFLTPCLVENTAFERFLLAKTVSDFEAIATEVGDMEFIQFFCSLRRRNGFPLPYLQSINKATFTEFQHCLKACEAGNDAVELMILEGEYGKAADLLLSSGVKENILMAQACLSPNLESTRKVVASVSHLEFSSLLAKLLCLSGDKKAAVQLLIETGQWMACLKYSKMLFDDDGACEFLDHWVVSNVDSPNQIHQYHTLAFMRDFHAVLLLLNSADQLSKGYALLKYIEEENIHVEESRFTEKMCLPPFETIKKTILERWEAVNQSPHAATIGNDPEA